MTETKIITKEPVPISHVTKILKAKKKGERAEIQNKVLDYSKKAARLTESECNKLMDEISNLGVPGLNREQIVAIANIVPATLTELRAVLAGKASLSSENFKKLQEVIVKYVKEK